MPELPEVETIKRGLNNITNKTISQVFRSNKKMRFDSHLDLALFEGQKITNLQRRARYLIIETSDKMSLIIHLGMSGRLVLKKNTNFDNYEIAKHDHFIAQIEDDLLIFNDPRRFGFVDLIKSDEISSHKLLKTLGPEPLSDEFDAKYLKTKLKDRTSAIKNLMMDNKIVVGVGNIYINESLFKSKIHPKRPAKSLKNKEIELLIDNIKKTLDFAINSGGSSINDYVDSNGNLGNFQNNFLVYGLEGQNCRSCNDNQIQRIVIGQRSTFFCENCQK